MPRAIITGASSGLGKDLSALLVDSGWEIVAIGRNESRLNDLIESCPPHQRPSIHPLIADLSDPRQVDGLVKKASSLFSEGLPPTHLINCAGFGVSGRIDDIEPEWFEKCWAVNFTSAVSLTRQILPIFRQAKGGIIMNVGSGVGRRALPFHSPYCTAKAALHSFTESLRVELKGSPVRAILFSPGPVASGFHDATIHRGKTIPLFPPFKGKPSCEIAQKMLKAIASGNSTVFLGWRANLAYHLNYWFPQWVDRLMSSQFKVLDAKTPLSAQK